MSLVLSIVVQAQTRGTRSIVVSETTGIRRTEYPVGTRVELPKGALADAAHARLRTGDADAPAQFTAETKWDDGSVRALAVDFNVSIGPLESRTYQLEYGSDVAAAPVARGLNVTEEAEFIQSGTVKFTRSGAPLIASAGYVKTEFVGKGANGLSLVDDSRQRHDFSGAQGVAVELVKRGPLNVTLRYTGRVPIDAAYSAPVTITFEMPNSKSWVKMAAHVDDPRRRVRMIVFEMPLAFGAFPWTWDFGTDNGTYGAFRNTTDTAVLTQVVDQRGPVKWTVETGPQGEPRPYEASAPGRAAAARGSGHILDARGAVAFGVDNFAKAAGMYTIALNGQGLVSYAFTPAQLATQHQLTVFQHFVSTPVPIGAATSPAAMLNPLAVAVR